MHGSKKAQEKRRAKRATKKATDHKEANPTDIQPKGKKKGKK